ncbi:MULTISPECIES: EscU/YscU/HrcU family type III secretion system export apparatus switch protein [Acetobacteraceae]|uniref:EscU/YscU/HrcU family type III secretion system export apparatus switch protein n=2 Tax=Acetobacteraceae TaxID=433 RepID=A0ABR9MPF0_9PROT|nr:MULTISPECIES: EscU/YscU/HrcU family type III secretion system export apparatus switch protein [Acetobacteraceae]MCL1562389.1 flagellar type III secretion system protein FlhB [Parasaccharibacter sp. TMW 2.1886]MCQ0040894.1 EscU/YscU/HrcU family type III secretion system export apparatus switch protein [Bombella sp.]MUG79914.1 flagellar type III secretion system protein FlhB [Bombella sp. ESL0380]QGT75513.1 flagellar type III secretion system protein FlhB [Bombella sp. ESL0368]MBE1723745.1 Es
MAEENGSGGGEKSQAPTEKRLQKAREEGNVAQSKELLILVALGTFLLVFALSIPASARQFMHEMNGLLLNFGLVPNDPAALYGFTLHAIMAGLHLIAPLMGTGACAILMGGVLQTGFLFRPAALKPDISRLSPLKGIKRIVGLNNLIELLKTIAKITVFSLILYKVALQTVSLAPQTERWTTWQLVNAMKSWFIYAGFMVLAIQCIITGLDEVWSRYHRFSKLRMSLQDIKDEMKQSEGDPQMKARLRQLRLSRSRRHMKKAVQEATVIVVNPTHYAVAIRYDQHDGTAPQIVAKGTDELAFRIRDIAREAKIPVMSNPPLARALHALPLDSEIPEEFWKPVATIIAYVVRLKTPGARAARPAEAGPS